MELFSAVDTRDIVSESLFIEVCTVILSLTFSLNAGEQLQVQNSLRSVLVPRLFLFTE